jgi:hypothetical protein
MRTGLTMIALLLTMTSAAVAEPTPRDAPRPGRAQKPLPVVVVATADTVHIQASTAPPPSSEPVRRPAPRITTCRCGDPQPTPDNQEN